MKLVAISDTHARHKEIEIPEGDVLIHCGDSCAWGTRDEFLSFIDWFDDQPHRHKIMVAGNHDQVLEKDRSLLSRIPDRIHYLEDKAVTIQGVKFYGSPWTPRFFKWAFMKERGESLAKVWAQIPDDTDVLITHGPPYGHGDLAPAYRGHPVARAAGCMELLKRVVEVRPAIHMFGHIHEGRGLTASDEYEGILFANVANAPADGGLFSNQMLPATVVNVRSPEDAT